jgi:putative colanic acid biosynthesis acetyltransferase WcaF
MLQHNINNSDAYQRPVFSIKNKLKRVLWQFSWLILCRYSPIIFHSWRSTVLRLFGAKIGNKNFIYPNIKIWAPWLLETEDVVTIGPGVEIYNPGGVFLGDHSILSQDSYLCGATHNYDSIDYDYIAKKIIVKRYSWICAKAIVLAGVTCGEGSVLGAGSIASKDLEEWTIYSGNPSKIIKLRKKIA